MKKSRNIQLSQSLNRDIFGNDMEEDNFVEPKEWTIITALDRVLSKAHDCRLSEKFWTDCRNPIDFLCQKLGLKDIQVVVLALLVEEGDALSWRKLGEYLGCSRITMMTYSEEIEELVEKRWMIRKGCDEGARFRSFEGFALAHGVVTALRHNETFVPEKIDGLSPKDFIIKVAQRFDDDIDLNSDSDDTHWLMTLCEANRQLPFCREVLKYDDTYVRLLFLAMAVNYADAGNTDNEGVGMDYIQRNFPHEYRCNGMRHKLRDGSHILLKDELIEYCCEDGIADNERYSRGESCASLTMVSLTT